VGDSCRRQKDAEYTSLSTSAGKVIMKGAVLRGQKWKTNLRYNLSATESKLERFGAGRWGKSDQAM